MSISPLEFSVIDTDESCAARRGLLKLPHGEVETPAFLPVGTQGSVKALTPEQVAQTGARMILANTYHLALRPGSDVVREAGGLHAFTGWKGPILTDSGGYQVFSLAELNKVDDEGVTFRSHIDGDEIRLTPSRCMEIQNDLGADIIMAFDECPPFRPPVSRLPGPWRGLPGGPGSAARPTSGRGTRPSSVSSRAAASTISGRRQPASCWSSIFPATPSGG